MPIFSQAAVALHVERNTSLDDLITVLTDLRDAWRAIDEEPPFLDEFSCWLRGFEGEDEECEMLRLTFTTAVMNDITPGESPEVKEEGE
jgi:hypothetical protein